MTEQTFEAMSSIYKDKRSWLITRSNFIGDGKYSGHWLGDNYGTWEQLASSINGMLDMNIFGIPYTGADICGFFEDTTEALCTKWMLAGSFYPFMRNHNAKYQIDQGQGLSIYKTRLDCKLQIDPCIRSSCIFRSSCSISR